MDPEFWRRLNLCGQKALVIHTHICEAHEGDDFKRWANLLTAKQHSEDLIKMIEDMYLHDVPSGSDGNDT